MTRGALAAAAGAYILLIEQHPEHRGLCEGQLGAALFFLGDYPSAVTHYKLAITHGDPDQQEDNIFEAAEASFREHGETDLLYTYLATFPSGSYRTQAEALLSATSPTEA